MHYDTSAQKSLRNGQFKDAQHLTWEPGTAARPCFQLSCQASSTRRTEVTAGLGHPSKTGKFGKPQMRKQPKTLVQPAFTHKTKYNQSAYGLLMPSSQSSSIICSFVPRRFTDRALLWPTPSSSERYFEALYPREKRARAAARALHLSSLLSLQPSSPFAQQFGIPALPQRPLPNTQCLTARSGCSVHAGSTQQARQLPPGDSSGLVLLDARGLEQACFKVLNSFRA